MALPEKPRSDKPAKRAEPKAPRKLGEAERKRLDEIVERRAKQHARILAALAK